MNNPKQIYRLTLSTDADNGSGWRRNIVVTVAAANVVQAIEKVKTAYPNSSGMVIHSVNHIFKLDIE